MCGGLQRDLRNRRTESPNLDSCHTTDNGLRLAELLANHGAYALNTLFISKKPSHRVTWKLGPGKKRLDYFVADKFLRQCCTIARAYPQQSAPFETNHFLCAADFRLPTRAQRKLIFKRRSPELKLDHSALKRDEEVRNQFSKRVAEVLGVVDPNADAEQLEQQLQAAITSAAKATLPEKLDDDSEWMTEEYTGMIEELVKLKSKDRSRMAKRVRRMSKRLRNRYFSIMATRINKAAEMREVEKEFRLASENSLLKASTSQYGRVTETVLESQYAHFSENFKAKPTPAATSLDNPEYVDALQLLEEVIKAGEPSLEEVKCEIAKLKSVGSTSSMWTLPSWLSTFMQFSEGYGPMRNARVRGLSPA